MNVAAFFGPAGFAMKELPFRYDDPMSRYGSLITPLFLLATGCPPADQKSSPAPSPSSSSVACSKVGQSCEVSPGKLGTCVQKDDCKEASACFVCQSQH